MERYVKEEQVADDRDDEYMDTDFAYQSIEHKKNRRCPCICSDRKASAMLMLAPGDKSSVNLNKRFCRYSRLCCIRAVLIVLVIIAVLGIIALLLWQFAVPSFVSLYLKSTEIDFGYVSLTDNLPDGTKSSDSLEMYAKASAATTFPFDIGLLIHTLEVRPGGPGIQPLIGKMHPKEELVLYRQNNGRFSLPATLKIANFTYFQQFASDLLLSDSAALRLTTPSNGGRVRLHMPFMPRNGWYIDFNIHNVRLDKTMTLTGCSGFPSANLEVFKLDDKPSKFKENGLNIHSRVRFWSDSSANVTDMGIVHFNVYAKEDPTRTRLGFLYTDSSLTIGPGWNVIHASGRFIASGIVATTLIEKYLSGQPTAMVAESPQVNASSDPLFSQFVSGLALSITLQGTPSSLITDAVMLMTVANIFKVLHALGEKNPEPIALQVQARLENPFGAHLTILDLQVGVTYKGELVGRGNTDKHISLGPYDDDWSARLDLVVVLTPEVRHVVVEFLESILSKKNTFIGLHGNFSFTSGGLTMNPRNYVQPPTIKACLEAPPKNGANPQRCHNKTKTT